MDRGRGRTAGTGADPGGEPPNNPRRERPVADEGIIVEVAPNLAAAVAMAPIDDVEPHILAEHVPYRVEVMGVEAVDIDRDARALGFRQDGERSVVRFERQFP